jgi:hypothetical protein
VGGARTAVKFGDVTGKRFGDAKGWLGNSVRKDGKGKYRLHAHVMAGDLVLKILSHSLGLTLSVTWFRFDCSSVTATHPKGHFVR